MREEHDAPDGIGRTAEEVKTAILGTLAKAVCSMARAEEEDGGTRVDIRAGDTAGNALYRGATLVRLRIHETDPEIVYDNPRPTCQPRLSKAAN